MKKLLLWLVMVVVMLAVLLGGAGYAMYAMTGDDKLPAQHPTLGDTELEPIGYDWSVPVQLPSFRPAFAPSGGWAMC